MRGRQRPHAPRLGEQEPRGRDELLADPDWYEVVVSGDLTEALVGGWQLSTIFRYRSGLPTSVAYGGLWPTNFSFTTMRCE